MLSADGTATITREIRIGIEGEGHFVLVLRLTLVMLMLYGASSPALAVAVQITCALMLLFPQLLWYRRLWVLLVLAMVLGNGREWYAIDNHKYLMTYWTLACALSLRDSQAPVLLRNTARLIVGGVFLSATLWKLIAGQYINGSFLYFTFLTDPRLQLLTAGISGVPREEVLAIRQALDFLGGRGMYGVALPVPTFPALKVLTLSLSWMALLIEGSVGLMNLSGSLRLYALRHSALMAFIVLTYFLLPVFPFAFVLILLGFVQCRDDDEVMKIRYLVILGFMHLTLIPWQTIVFSRW